MLRVGNYLFKRAETKQEFDQIHRLNHRTFVEEIPQHQPTLDGVLVDKFHHKNSYLIVLREDRLVGMLSVHDEPPFSVTDRLADPAILYQAGERPLEVRLLAIEPAERNSTMFFGLIYSLYEYAQKNGNTHLVISGVEGRVNLYERLGFSPLGPAVRCGEAAFVPMVLTIGRLPVKLQKVKKMWETHLDRVVPKETRELVCLLPGPVTMSPSVQDAFHKPPIYHRGPEFIRRFVQVRNLLGDIVGGRDVALLNGSGTLANEAIAATLAAGRRTADPRARGILLVNGEFGERLSRQASRFGLEPRILSWPWGHPWNLEEVEEALAAEPEGSWVWGVHQESSTGVLNDLPGLTRVARRRGVRVVMDCISSLGAVPIDLSQVYLASGTSGKSLGSYAGAALVFADKEALASIDRQYLPSYFDIYAALVSEGPCYTFPSPTLAALEASLRAYATPESCQATYARYHQTGVQVRQELRRLGLQPLAREEFASPVITTFTPPGEGSSLAFVNLCRSWGYSIGGESTYLSQRRFVQIATMGAMTWDQFGGLFDCLEKLVSKQAFLASV